jgi:hypothetical protein
VPRRAVCGQQRISAGQRPSGKDAGVAQREMDYFMQVFVPSFQLSLDEISQDSPL